MKPASSVILFTTASGAGYGLLFLLGLLGSMGLLPADRLFGAISLGLASGLATLGLISSTFHLGHPERAWRALTQWRSSWLSREGVAAVFTYLPAGVFGWGWIILERTDGPFAAAGIVSAVGAALTVSCTGMIYASLKSIRQWHHRYVVPAYLLLAVMSGALWLTALMSVFGRSFGFALAVALVAAVFAWGLKLLYWREIDHDMSSSTAQTATGLTGTVRLLDPPHTEENYLLKEMGFRVARKHGVKLRRLAVVMGWGLPVAAIAVSIVLPNGLQSAFMLVAAVIAMAGVVIERWLFFAEAKHTVTLYYGQTAV